jgi:CSLREA domain-containing protein
MDASTDGKCSTSHCTLREAISAANGFAEGAIVTLAAGASYTLNTVDNSADGDNGLPNITGKVTIAGSGATIARDAGAPDFRIFHVAASGNLQLNDLTIRNGRSSAGGAIYNLGTLGIRGGTLANNIANEGGGIFTRGALALISSTLANNSAPNGGGALRSVAGAQTTILKSSILDNTGEYGGGLADFGALTIEDSRIGGNSASSGGGLFSGGTVTIRRSLFSGNVATNNDGGALYAGGTLLLVNSTIYDNSAGGLGGGIVTSAAGAPAVTIQHSTFAGNRARSGGNILKFNGQLTVKGTIIANATAGGNCAGQIDDGGSNLQFPSKSCGASIAEADPLLGPLQDNGGPTLTMAIPGGSPAIDQASATTCPPLDQRGITRPQGQACDIGAYEAP